MVIKYQISPYPALMEDFIVKVWEAQNDNPGAEVYTLDIPQALGGGHPNIETVTINGLDKVVHVVRLYTAITANKLHDYNVEPLADLMEAFTPIQFKVGGGGNSIPPNAGDSFYGDNRIGTIGEDDYTIYRTNYGPLIRDIHYTHIPTVDPLLGGFSLIAPDVFQDKEEFTISIKPIMKIPVNDSVVGKWFGAVAYIGANTIYNPVHLRKLLTLDNAAEFDFTIDPPIGYGYAFQNFGFSQTSCKVKFTNKPLLWGNTTKSEIILPPFTEALFTFDGNNYHVVYLSSSSWVNAASVVTPGQNIAIGEIYLGNVAVGDFVTDVVHGLNITGNYYVFLSCRSTSVTVGKDDDIQLAWYHHPTNQANAFKLGYGIPNGSVGHNITICYLLVKA